MKKKDYQLIAGSVWRTLRNVEWFEKNQVRKQAKLATLKLITTDLVANLAHDNPKFDEAKFLKDCGYLVTN